MPLYEYECPKCGNTFEKLVSYAEADLPRACPVCGHGDATRQISRVAMHTTGGETCAAGSGSTSCGTGFG